MYKNVLLSVDLGDTKSLEESVNAAVTHMQAFDSTLRVMTVVPDFGMSIVGSFFPAEHKTTLLEAAQRQTREFAQAHVPDGIAVQHIVGHGTVYEDVLRGAEETNADLIIIAASRPLAGKFMLGPNAARIVRHTACSALVVRN